MDHRKEDPLIRLFERLRAERGNYENTWREIATYVYPEEEGFFRGANETAKGRKKRQRLYDMTASESLPKYSSVLSSLITPRNSKYHKLEHPDSTRENSIFSEYYERVNEILFKARYAYTANFQAQTDAMFKSLGAFGNGCLFVDEDHFNKGQIRYKAIFLGDVYIQPNHQGQVDHVFRRFDLSNAAAVSNPLFQDRLPDDVLKQVKDNPYAEQEYLHVVVPNTDKPRGVRGYDRRDWKSIYYHRSTGTVLHEGYYGRMPYIFPRWELSVHEYYGIGPAGLALPTIRVVNRQERSQLRAIEKQVDPAILAHDDGWVGAGRDGISMDPGTIVYGGMSADGRRLYDPLQTGARTDLNFQDMEYKRNQIKAAFLVDQFNLNNETKRMTAFEVTARMREQGDILGPIIGRLETEFLGPLIDRELELLADMGKLPPPPQGAEDYEIRFQSPLTRLQMSEELVGIEQTKQMALELSQFDPNVADIIDAEAMLRMTARGTGAPNATIRSPEEVAEIQAAKAQAQQAQTLLEAAPQMAKAAKDAAQADQIQQGF